MKIAENEYAKKEDFKSTLIFPLVPEKEEELSRGNSISFELYATPGDNTTPRYKKQVRILHGDEDPRTVVNWIREVESLFIGLNMTTFAPQRSIIKTLLKDNALTNFTNKALADVTAAYQAAHDACTTNARRADVEANGVDHYGTTAIITTAINFMAESAMPKKILQRAKRELRRSCRKPATMKVRDYAMHLMRINMQELPKVPPFLAANSLDDGEMLDIALYGSPKKWQGLMDQHGFDPMEHTFQEVIEFMERLESSEEFDRSAIKSEKNDSKSSSNKKKKSSYSTDKSASKSGTKHCLLHGDNSSHTTEECHKLKAEATRLKGDSDFKNKTWTKKAQDHKDKTRKDLAAIVQKAIKKGVRKELSNIESRKRDTDSDDSSDGEVNMLETLESLGNFDLNDVDLDMITEHVDVDDL